MKICPRCRHIIPGWAENYCPTCGDGSGPAFGSIQPTEPSINWFDDSTYGGPFPPLRPKAKSRVSPEVINQETFDLRLSLEGYNQLLLDIYKEHIWLGHLLVRLGIPDARVDSWRNDRPSLQRLLICVVRDLTSKLEQILPAYKPSILLYWYGINGCPRESADVIATKVGTTERGVEVYYRSLIAYLRKSEGKALLEGILLSAAKAEE
jgi:hypothetical protein